MTPRRIVWIELLRAAGLPVAGLRRDAATGVESPEVVRQLTTAEQATVAAVASQAAALAEQVSTEDFRAALEAVSVDAVSDATLDLILAAKALPPNATAADVRERAKADRRGRRGTRDAGGRP